MASGSVAVVGAGALGGWTALWMRRGGADVILLDAAEPGHARSSSGGETRLLRCGYGTAVEFSALAWQAARLWAQEEPALGGDIWRRNGVLWLFRSRADGYAAATEQALTRLQVPFCRLDAAEVQRRWPVFRAQPLECALLEPEAGFLQARRACRGVQERFLREGGQWRLATARPGRGLGGRLLELELSPAEHLGADAFVFACGPWLPKLFPGVPQAAVRVTRQEVHTFAVPPDRPEWTADRMPCWIDYNSGIWYGVPAGESRGFKIGDHRPGPAFDPDHGDRTPSAAGLAAARAFLRQSFPALRDAALVGAEVCQYELAPQDRPFCLRHPEWSNVWLVGGGSGHGFKLGPALGAAAAAQVLAG
ncbi:MAG: FAD-dependent oxidoreductase [Planctomycetota bacterium]|nr:MAG: FAD-dependent oxidoreductase [Planctomycetota bacterium]